MTGKWFQPFPGHADQGVLELHSKASEPWLDLKIAQASRNIARVRRVDLKLGKRLEIQLRLANQMANLLSPRFSGQHIGLQLRDEDPGVGCSNGRSRRFDLDSSPSFQTLLPWNQRLQGSASSYAPNIFLIGRTESLWCLARSNDGKQRHHSRQSGIKPPLSAVSTHSLRAIVRGCAFQSGRSVPKR